MKKNFIVKICGIKSEAVAKKILKYKPTMIGLVFVPKSSRYVDKITAQRIAKIANEHDVLTVGVFQNQPIEQVRELIESISLDYLQLHGEESPAYCKKINVPIIKKINLKNTVAQTKKYMDKYKKVVNFFLIDRPIQGEGSIIDMNQVETLSNEYSIIIAGGLDHDNIENVLEKAGKNIAGVDVSGGVESSRGIKDELFVRGFIKKVRRQINNIKAYAVKLDKNDPLHKYRKEFFRPKNIIYMDGNSLGLFSKRAEKSLNEIITSYKAYGIDAWLKGENPLFYMAEKIGGLLAPLVGALPDEVVVANSTTVNLHQLLTTFYKPYGKRTKIIIDEFIFPSDMYAVKSQLLLHGLKPEDHLVIVKSRDGKYIDETDIISKMSDDVAIVLLPTIVYRTAQMLDVKLLTEEAHKRGILIGFDACHSIGAIPHNFHEENIDFAVFCTYKYVNGGPGSPAGLFLHKKHFSKIPALAGWFSSQKDKQFDMSPDLIPALGAGAYQIGTPHIFSMAPLLGAIDLINEIGINQIREKSLSLTDYMIELIKSELASFGFIIATPLLHEQRGGHIALEHTEAARICKSMKAHGVIPDFRPPNIIRLAPIALYSSFYDVFRLVMMLKKIMIEKDYYKFTNDREIIA